MTSSIRRLWGARAPRIRPGGDALTCSADDDEPDTLVDVPAESAELDDLGSIDRLLGFEPLDTWWPRVRTQEDLIGAIQHDARRRSMVDPTSAGGGR